jgi:hypothetical protein
MGRNDASWGNDFGWALKQLRDGEKLCRKGWNGKGIWINLQVPDEHSKMTEPYIYMEYPKGHANCANGMRIPWLASQGDMLANDWERFIP